MRLIFIVLLIVSSFANAETKIAVNMHGYSYHFKDHPDIVNEKHRMIGGEYCDNQGYTQLCASYAHFRDRYGYPNNAYGLHSRYLLHDYVTIGIMGAYVHRCQPGL